MENNFTKLVEDKKNKKSLKKETSFINELNLEDKNYLHLDIEEKRGKIKQDLRIDILGNEHEFESIDDQFEIKNLSKFANKINYMNYLHQNHHISINSDNSANRKRKFEYVNDNRYQNNEDKVFFEGVNCKNKDINIQDLFEYDEDFTKNEQNPYIFFENNIEDVNLKAKVDAITTFKTNDDVFKTHTVKNLNNYNLKLPKSDMIGPKNIQLSEKMLFESKTYSEIEKNILNNKNISTGSTFCPSKENENIISQLNHDTNQPMLSDHINQKFLPYHYMYEIPIYNISEANINDDKNSIFFEKRSDKTLNRNNSNIIAISPMDIFGGNDVKVENQSDIEKHKIPSAGDSPSIRLENNEMIDRKKISKNILSNDSNKADNDTNKILEASELANEYDKSEISPQPKRKYMKKSKSLDTIQVKKENLSLKANNHGDDISGIDFDDNNYFKSFKNLGDISKNLYGKEPRLNSAKELFVKRRGRKPKNFDIYKKAVEKDTHLLSLNNKDIKDDSLSKNIYFPQDKFSYEMLRQKIENGIICEDNTNILNNFCDKVNSEVKVKNDAYDDKNQVVQSYIHLNKRSLDIKNSEININFADQQSKNDKGVEIQSEKIYKEETNESNNKIIVENQENSENKNLNKINVNKKIFLSNDIVNGLNKKTFIEEINTNKIYKSNDIQKNINALNNNNLKITNQHLNKQFSNEEKIQKHTVQILTDETLSVSQNNVDNSNSSAKIYCNSKKQKYTNNALENKSIGCNNQIINQFNVTKDKTIINEKHKNCLGNVKLGNIIKKIVINKGNQFKNLKNNNLYQIKNIYTHENTIPISYYHNNNTSDYYGLYNNRLSNYYKNPNSKDSQKKTIDYNVIGDTNISKNSYNIDTRFQSDNKIYGKTKKEEIQKYKSNIEIRKGDGFVYPRKNIEIYGDLNIKKGFEIDNMTNCDSNQNFQVQSYDLFRYGLEENFEQENYANNFNNDAHKCKNLNKNFEIYRNRNAIDQKKMDYNIDDTKTYKIDKDKNIRIQNTKNSFCGNFDRKLMIKGESNKTYNVFENSNPSMERNQFNEVIIDNDQAYKTKIDQKFNIYKKEIYSGNKYILNGNIKTKEFSEYHFSPKINLNQMIDIKKQHNNYNNQNINLKKFSSVNDKYDSELNDDSGYKFPKSSYWNQQNVKLYTNTENKIDMNGYKTDIIKNQNFGNDDYIAKHKNIHDNTHNKINLQYRGTPAFNTKSNESINLNPSLYSKYKVENDKNIIITNNKPNSVVKNAFYNKNNERNINITPEMIKNINYDLNNNYYENKRNVTNLKNKSDKNNDIHANGNGNYIIYNDNDNVGMGNFRIKQVLDYDSIGYKHKLTYNSSSNIFKETIYEFNNIIDLDIPNGSIKNIISSSLKVFEVLRDIFYFSISNGGFLKKKNLNRLFLLLKNNYLLYRDIYVFIILPFEQFFFKKKNIFIFESIRTIKKSIDYTTNMDHNKQDSLPSIYDIKVNESVNINDYDNKYDSIIKNKIKTTNIGGHKNKTDIKSIYNPAFSEFSSKNYGMNTFKDSLLYPNKYNIYEKIKCNNNNQSIKNINDKFIINKDKKEIVTNDILIDKAKVNNGKEGSISKKIEKNYAEENILSDIQATKKNIENNTGDYSVNISYKFEKHNNLTNTSKINKNGFSENKMETDKKMKTRKNFKKNHEKVNVDIPNHVFNQKKSKEVLQTFGTQRKNLNEYIKDDKEVIYNNTIENNQEKFDQVAVKSKSNANSINNNEELSKDEPLENDINYKSKNKHKKINLKVNSIESEKKPKILKKADSEIKFDKKATDLHNTYIYGVNEKKANKIRRCDEHKDNNTECEKNYENITLEIKDIIFKKLISPRFLERINQFKKSVSKIAFLNDQHNLGKDQIVYILKYGSCKDVCLALNYCKYRRNDRQTIDQICEIYLDLYNELIHKSTKKKSEKNIIKGEKNFDIEFLKEEPVYRDVKNPKLFKRNIDNFNSKIIEFTNNNDLNGFENNIIENSAKSYSHKTNKYLEKNFTNAEYDDVFFTKQTKNQYRFLNIPNEVLFLLIEVSLIIIVKYIKTFSLENSFFRKQVLQIVKKEKKMKDFGFIGYKTLNKIIRKVMKIKYFNIDASAVFLFIIQKMFFIIDIDTILIKMICKLIKKKRFLNVINVLHKLKLKNSEKKKILKTKIITCKNQKLKGVKNCINIKFSDHIVQELSNFMKNLDENKDEIDNFETIEMYIRFIVTVKTYNKLLREIVIKTIHYKNSLNQEETNLGIRRILTQILQNIDCESDVLIQGIDNDNIRDIIIEKLEI